MNYELTPIKVLKVHIICIIMLILANLLGIFSTIHLGHDYIYGIIPLFDFNTEKNIPTLFSTIMLLICSGLNGLIALKNSKVKISPGPWIGLSLIFLFLSIDELNGIHERFSAPSSWAFEASGPLYYAWVAPYGLALIVFILVYSRFLLHLPRNIMLLFLASGAIFVSGALGFEMLGGNFAEASGTNNLTYCLYYTTEESLEMLGIALFLFTLLTYITNTFHQLKVSILASKKLST